MLDLIQAEGAAPGIKSQLGHQERAVRNISSCAWKEFGHAFCLNSIYHYG